ncbi:uncharacterized protein V6R79_013120 [Siganus canaliculatus]
MVEETDRRQKAVISIPEEGVIPSTSSVRGSEGAPVARAGEKSQHNNVNGLRPLSSPQQPQHRTERDKVKTSTQAEPTQDPPPPKNSKNPQRLHIAIQMSCCCVRVSLHCKYCECVRKSSAETEPICAPATSIDTE